MTHIRDIELDGYMAERGYTRGACSGRGDMVIVGGTDARIVTWDRYMGYDISEPMALETAEAAIMGARPQVSRAFQDAAAFEQFLAEHDGPKGYGH